MTLISDWLRAGLLRAGPGRVITANPRLIIVGFVPLDLSSHWFNELVSFKAEGNELGLDVRLMVPRATDADLVAALAAEAVLEPLPELDVDAENFVAHAVTFADTPEAPQALWARLDAENPGPQDLIYFPRGHPILIRGIGMWLEKRPPERHPNVFFRIIGDELTDLNTGRFRARAAFYRLACSDLRTRAGQERVFFLVNSVAKARSVSRVCGRRPFMMQHHFGGVAAEVAATVPTTPTIYVHLNARSGRLAGNLLDIIRRVVAIEPSVRFLIRAPAELADMVVVTDSIIGPCVDILSAEQSLSDYIKNLARCSIVWLAYEAQPYKALTSGIFTEAASLGKPLVVPEGTWMAEKITEGYGVGSTFEDPAAECVARVLLDAVRGADQLGAAARDIAPRLKRETGCRRFIERMIEFAQSAPDMEPRYRVGDQIDFSNVLDSRCFMREGWGDTEPWGVWTVDRRARLTLRLDAVPAGRLTLNALALAFRGKGRDSILVRVSVADQPIAEWAFDTADANQARWLTAELPPLRGEFPVADIWFDIDEPASPFAEGLSGDRRTLGLALSKLFITSALR